MRLFADTSGLFAAVVRNDVMHVRARSTLERVIVDRHPLVSTSAVLLETMALLQARVGLGAALDFDRIVRPRLEVVWVDEALYVRAFHRLERVGIRTVSLVDCASFEVMDGHGLSEVFGYDEDFAAQGFRVVGLPEDLGP